VEDGSKTQAFRRDAERGIEAVVQRLRGQEKFTDTILDNLPLALFCKNADDGYRFVLWNKRQEDITGITREEAIGHTDSELFSSQAAKYFREIDEGVINSGRSLEIPEEKISSPTVGKIWLRTFKCPITGPDGTQLLLGVSEDITSHIKDRERLHRTSKEIESLELQLIQAEKLESIGRLAAGVAHEVKNPLACLMLGAQYLERALEDPSDDVKNVIEEMKNAVARGEQIVRGLVDFSSLRQLQVEPIDPQTWLDRAIGFVRHECIRASVRIRCDYQHQGALAAVDSAKMEQVLVNLLTNSIHALELVEDRADRSLEVTTCVCELVEAPPDEGDRSGERVRKGDHVVRIEIRDSGPGFPPDKLSVIFDPFFTTKPTGKGTGLGMSVARKIIALHGGMIEIRNRKRGGAVVALSLKVATEFEDTPVSS